MLHSPEMFQNYPFALSGSLLEAMACCGNIVAATSLAQEVQDASRISTSDDARLCGEWVLPSRLEVVA